MKILVTGADGQLGQTMRRAVGGCRTHDFLFVGKKELDITELSSVRAALRGADIVINCAAYTDVNAAEDNVSTAYAVNVCGAGNLAAAAAAENALLVHISTDYVFSGEENTPITEKTAPAPLNAYGRSKWEGEQAILQSGCRHIILRTSWLYSPFGKNFVRTMLNLMATRPEVSVVNDQAGAPTNADDLAAAILSIIDTPSPAEGTYHYSNEGVCSWYDFAVAIAELTGSSCVVSPCRSNDFPGKVTRPAYSVLDKSKIRNSFGLHIPHWYSSLRHFLQQQSHEQS